MFMTTKRHEEILAEQHRAFAKAMNAEQSASRTKGRLAAELMAERDKARAALTEITKLETPSCAHIGKRMAAVARGALPA